MAMSPHSITSRASPMIANGSVSRSWNLLPSITKYDVLSRRPSLLGGHFNVSPQYIFVRRYSSSTIYAKHTKRSLCRGDPGKNHMWLIRNLAYIFMVLFVS